MLYYSNEITAVYKYFRVLNLIDCLRLMIIQTCIVILKPKIPFYFSNHTSIFYLPRQRLYTGFLI